MKIQNLKTVSYRTPLPPIGSLSKDDGDGKEKKKSSRFRAFLHGVGDPGLAGGSKFLLFCVRQSVKTKETNPTRPGSPTPCKQTLRLAKKQLCTLFLYISLPSLHDYDVKMPNFTFCGGREHKTTTLFFFSWTSILSFRIQIQKNSPTFDELNEVE